MATIISTLIVTLIIFVGKLHFNTSSDLFTSIFQGGVRYNSYVFIALSQSLSGFFVAYMVILTNIMSVLAMNYYGTGSKKSLSGALLALTKKLPDHRRAVGGADEPVQPTHYRRDKTAVRVSVSRCNATEPDVGWRRANCQHAYLQAGFHLLCGYAEIGGNAFDYHCAGSLFRCHRGVPARIAILYSAVRCAGNAYILAQQMGGDHEAMASIITSTTLLSIITVTFILGSVAL